MISLTVKQAILNIVSEQLSDGTPPQTRATLKRLLSEGFTQDDANALIAEVVLAEVVRVLKNEQVFDNERYIAMLERLPEIPYAQQDD